MGTTTEYFERYKYRGGRALEFAEGRAFDDLFDAVIGADVAATLGYTVDEPLVVAHGLASFVSHDNQPFRVSGILAKTGTPVDRTVIVSLEAIEAIHVDWQSGAQVPGKMTPPDEIRQMDLTPGAITAAMIGVKSRLQIFALQRSINQYPEEPLLAVLPGVALQELWGTVGIAETALVGVSGMVVATALLGMAAMIFSGLNERRREMAILRAVGARPVTIMGMLMLEAVLMAVLAALFGILLLYGGMWVMQPYVDAAFGLYLPIEPPSSREGLVVGGVIVAAALTWTCPAFVPPQVLV